MPVEHIAPFIAPIFHWST